MLREGIRGLQSAAATEANTAETIGSGTLRVFATPAMTALMEKTCWMSIQDELEEGSGSVGTALNITHVSPTPVGMTVTCESEVTEVNGRSVTFRVVCRDECGIIGEGTHSRVIIRNERFQAKADTKGK